MKKYFKNLSILLIMIFTLIQPLSALEIVNNDIIENNVVSIIENLENVDLSIKNIIDLYDVNGEMTYQMFIFDDGGYAIATKNTHELSEYSLTSGSKFPYANCQDTTYKLVYGGPFNYLMKDVNDNYYDVNIGEKIEIEINDDLMRINEQFVEGNVEKQVVMDNSVLPLATEPTSWTGISSTRFSRYNNSSWVNNNSTCGPHSAGVMLAYYQDYYPSLVAFDSSVRTKDSTSSGTLITKIAALTSNPTATTPQSVGVGTANFLNIYNTAGSYITCFYSSSGTWSTATSKINAGKPVCIGLSGAGGLHKYGWHWVTAYAYGTDSDGNGYYRCHTNWAGEYAVTIRTAWTIGIAYLNK